MRIFISFFVLISLFFTSCNNNNKAVDIKNSNIELVFKPFYSELYNLPPDSIWSYVPYLNQKYGVFFDTYNTAIINIGGTNQLDYDKKLLSFLTDPDICEVYNDVNKTFEHHNFVPILNNAIKRYNYYFPQNTVPQLYAHVSGFNQSIVVDTGYISISLDNYLGYNHKYYQMLRTQQYIMANMHPQKIVSDVVFALGVTEFPYTPKTDDLLSQMLYYGKIHLFIDELLPKHADTLKWGFSSTKLKWCKRNEQMMWLYLVENKQLFSTERKVITRYINDAPFTTPFSRFSPGRSGRWLGYQIILSYLKNNPQVTLSQLMLNNDYHLILSQSKYKP